MRGFREECLGAFFSCRWPLGSLRDRPISTDELARQVAWHQALTDAGCPGDSAQVRRVADFVASNSFRSLQSLRFAEHPCKWFGAARFNHDELTFLHSLVRQQTGKKRRGRVVSFNVVWALQSMLPRCISVGPAVVEECPVEPEPVVSRSVWRSPVYGARGVQLTRVVAGRLR